LVRNPQKQATGNSRQLAIPDRDDDSHECRSRARQPIAISQMPGRRSRFTPLHPRYGITQKQATGNRQPATGNFQIATTTHTRVRPGEKTGDAARRWGGGAANRSRFETKTRRLTRVGVVRSQSRFEMPRHSRAAPSWVPEILRNRQQATGSRQCPDRVAGDSRVSASCAANRDSKAKTFTSRSSLGSGNPQKQATGNRQCPDRVASDSRVSASCAANRDSKCQDIHEPLHLGFRKSSETGTGNRQPATGNLQIALSALPAGSL
jgi:hypothetical protein